MNIQFSVGGTLLEANEALALLNLAAGHEKGRPTIELDRLIDLKTLDATSLFQTAVSTGNQELASLAWKISVNKKAQPFSKDTVSSPKLTLVKPAKEKNLESIIETLNNSNSYYAMGAAMLLRQASQKEWTTIRETAIDFINDMWLSSPNTRNCKFYRGFSLSEGKLTPIDLNSGIERKHTFHVSPMYIALREGLVYCTEQNLVEIKRTLSVGATRSKTDTPKTSHMRRVYYRFKLTERGVELMDMWADIDRYINKTFAGQIAS